MIYVVDVGANPIDGEPPYATMLRTGLCMVVGFDPNPDALARLKMMGGSRETYLPRAIGDGGRHTLHVCAAEGMTSLLRPDPAALARFPGFEAFGSVITTREIQTVCLDRLIFEADMLKIDIQGGELSVFQSSPKVMAEVLVVHTEVSFAPLYEDQPLFGEVDAELRSHGLVLHSFATMKRWPTSAGHRLLEADAVYVRLDVDDDQRRRQSLIMQHCYKENWA